MSNTLTSFTNPKVKWLKNLHKNNVRKKEGVVVVEGAKEIACALDGGFLPMCMFICPEVFNEELVLEESTEIYIITKEIFSKMSYRSASDGLIAVFYAQTKKLDSLSFGESPLFIVVEGVEKPGNLGAIVRSADGAGVDAVLVCDQRADIFNPNAIRASVGTIFTKQIVTASSEEIFDFLEKHEVKSYGAVLSDRAKIITSVNFVNPSAIILGTEHDGLSDFWKQRSEHIKIPMLGTNDSLNVSNAAAVLAYEAVRQRYDNTDLA